MGGKVDPNAAAPATSADAPKVQLTLTGAASANVEVASGTKLGDALKSAGVEMGGYQFRSGGRMVGKDTPITADMAVTATAKASGG